MTRSFCNNDTRDSFARNIAPVLNDLAAENEKATYGNRIYEMSFSTEGKEALRSFYADTCEEMTDGDIKWFETICKEASESYAYWNAKADEARKQEGEDYDNSYELSREAEDCENRAEEVLRDISGEIFEWVMGESSYIELDNESATDAGEYRRVYIYLNELLWKEGQGKNRLSQTAYDIIESATSDWKDAQDYCH